MATLVDVDGDVLIVLCELKKERRIQNFDKNLKSKS